MRLFISIVSTLFFIFSISLGPVAAQQADIPTIEKRWSQLIDAGNYAAALVEAQKLEEAVKARFGVKHAGYALVFHFQIKAYQSLASMQKRKHSPSAPCR